MKKIIYSCDWCGKEDIPLYAETFKVAKEFLYTISVADLEKTMHICRSCWEELFAEAASIGGMTYPAADAFLDHYKKHGSFKEKGRDDAETESE